MIQRKQTLFLLAAVILGMVHFQAWPLFVLQMLASALCVYAIFLFKARKKQAAFCLAAIVVNLLWYITLAVLIQQGMASAQLPYTAALPMVAAILCLMARKGVLDDEKLVRAADRIR